MLRSLVYKTLRNIQSWLKGRIFNLRWKSASIYSNKGISKFRYLICSVSRLFGFSWCKSLLKLGTTVIQLTSKLSLVKRLIAIWETYIDVKSSASPSALSNTSVQKHSKAHKNTQTYYNIGISFGNRQYTDLKTIPRVHASYFLDFRNEIIAATPSSGRPMLPNDKEINLFTWNSQTKFAVWNNESTS